MKVLVTAASKHGATAEIAAAIGGVLESRGIETMVSPPELVETIEGYDAIVLGSAVYAGHWLGAATELVNRTRTELDDLPVWLFSSGPVGNPARKIVRMMGQEPVDIAEIRGVTRARDHHTFAGKLDRRDVGPAQRAALMAFRGLEGDFRDWDDVRVWADEIADELTEPEG